MNGEADIDTLLLAADAALYRVKTGGRAIGHAVRNPP